MPHITHDGVKWMRVRVTWKRFAYDVLCICFMHAFLRPTLDEACLPVTKKCSLSAWAGVLEIGRHRLVQISALTSSWSVVAKPNSTWPSMDTFAPKARNEFSGALLPGNASFHLRKVSHCRSPFLAGRSRE